MTQARRTCAAPLPSDASPSPSEAPPAATTSGGYPPSGAARARRHRARRNAGRAILRVEVDIVDLASKLQVMGLLPSGDGASRQELELATSALLAGQVLLLRE